MMNCPKCGGEGVKTKYGQRYACKKCGHIFKPFDSKKGIVEIKKSDSGSGFLFLSILFLSHVHLSLRGRRPLFSYILFYPSH